jgi:trk system potassium uptake protein TrkH
MIILALFQLGGLGIITFVAFISVVSTRSLPVPQMVAFRNIISSPSMSDLKRRIAGIVLITFLIEVAGVMSLFILLPGEMHALDRLKWSAFHAVSAFCNAGFALQATSLEYLQTHVPINTAGLIHLCGEGGEPERGG